MDRDDALSAKDGRPRQHPLIDAAKYWDADAVDAFLAAGTDPRVADEHGWTPLHAAGWMSDAEEVTRRIIESLVRAGADPNARDVNGRTPLHDAVEGDQPNVTAVLALLRAGADPNAQDEEGSTPLHAAVREVARTCVDALLAAGADWSIRDSDGDSPADLAGDAVARWEDHVREGPADLSQYGISTGGNPQLSDESMRATFAQTLDDARAILERAHRESGEQPQA